MQDEGQRVGGRLVPASPDMTDTAGCESVALVGPVGLTWGCPTARPHLSATVAGCALQYASASASVATPR